MKKTYITPAMLTVQLGTMKMMAESLAIRTTSTIDNSEDILVKEEIRDVNLWDNEW